MAIIKRTGAVFAGVIVVAVAVAGFGPAKTDVCVQTYGEYCSPYTNQCEAPNPANWGQAKKICGAAQSCNPDGGRTSQCDKSCGIVPEPGLKFCSNTTALCSTDELRRCTPICRSTNAYCSKFFKACVIPEKDPKKRQLCTPFQDGTNPCKGFGQKCSPLLGACVTVLPEACLPKENTLWFRLLNLSPAKGTPKRCGDVDGGSRVPDGFFDIANYKTLTQYITYTIQQYNVPGQFSQYLQQGRCADAGYTKAAGSAIEPWAPADMMQGVCSGTCGCTFPDCPDVPTVYPDPKVPFGKFLCSLCGPKYNKPIKINYYEQE